VKGGASTRVQDQKSQTPLHVAAAAGHDRIVRALKDLVELNVQDKEGHTALHAASAAGHVVAAKELLKQGADSRAVDSSGNTALHLACASPAAEEFIALLLSSDLNPTNK
jgi:ankyrin repeat protein